MHFSYLSLMMICLSLPSLISGSSESFTSVSSIRQNRELKESNKCNHESMDDLIFTVVENDATGLAVENDIRQNLEKLGISIETKLLSKDEWNDAQTDGDFHLSFTETWGAPYDPHSYALGWIGGSGGEGHMQAFSNFESPKNREELFDLITNATMEESSKIRRLKWLDIHNYYHSQAVMLPLWGKRIPTLMNSRLTGYQAGHQQYDYPVHKLIPITGSRTITISPGSQTGLFQSVGRLDPHTYRPNEFFANNWVYEGLVTYGEGGQVLPSLAKSWKIGTRSYMDGEQYTFYLRENVVFHDGAKWNCDAAKMNFDHVFAGKLQTDYHNWYGVPLYIDTWNCLDDMTFAVTTTVKYSPFLQELSYIRPLRMLSPNAFAEGSTSSSNTANSCHVGWGTIGSDENPNDVVCAGISNITGTGPFIFQSRETEPTTEVDLEVMFQSNPNYWDGVPDFDYLKIEYYKKSEDAKNALLNGNLDIIWGSGVLSDKDIAQIQDDDDSNIQVFHSDDVQNVILLLNSGKPPLDDINVRKTIIHAIDKSSIIEKELAGLQKPVDTVFPQDAPFCDVDLTPRWDYDYEKASLLFCNSNKSLSLGLGIGLGSLFLLTFVLVLVVNKKRVKAETELKLLRKGNAEAA